MLLQVYCDDVHARGAAAFERSLLDTDGPGDSLAVCLTGSFPFSLAHWLTHWRTGSFHFSLAHSLHPCLNGSLTLHTLHTSLSYSLTGSLTSLLAEYFLAHWLTLSQLLGYG